MPCNDDIYPSKLNKVRVYYQTLRLNCQHCDIPRTFFWGSFEWSNTMILLGNSPMPCRTQILLSRTRYFGGFVLFQNTGRNQYSSHKSYPVHVTISLLVSGSEPRFKIFILFSFWYTMVHNSHARLYSLQHWDGSEVYFLATMKGML